MSENKKTTMAGYFSRLLIPRSLKDAALHRFAGLVDHFLKSRPFVDAMRNITDRNRQEVLELLNPALLENDKPSKAMEAEHAATWEMVERRLMEVADAERTLATELLKRREKEWLVAENAVRRGFSGYPTASIIIPVFNKDDLTYRCLRSVFLANGKTSYETIVVDNGSSDRTADLLGSLSSAVKVIRNEINLGFVDACNQGAAQAKGRFLVFLNNDTEVKDGWLDRLVETTDLFDDVGAVGAKLLYPDGTLQEAGGIVWQDATGANFGNGGDPLDLRYIYLREVDYCSGACLLVRKELFEKLGGFDTRYAPAYFEDSDLCFGIRALGYKVLYQPLCEVIHFEGATAGRDVDSGFKQFQNINRPKFIEKWSDALKLQPVGSSDNLDRAADRRTGPNILVIDHKVPRYDEDSGSYRIFQWMKILTRVGCRVSFMLRPWEVLDRYGLEMGGIGVRLTREANGEVWDELKAGMFDLVLIDRVTMALEYLEQVKAADPGVPVVFDTVDLHFIREIRMAELHADQEMMEEALKTKEKELAIARACDLTIAITEVDKQYLLKESPSLEILVVPNIHPTLDITPTTEGRASLMFIGGYDHPPNVDAMLYFTRDIYQLIVRELGELELLIVGSNPPDEIKALSSGKVVVTGYVSKTIPYYRKSRVFVCPLRYGAGMKGKIGEAMSHGVPVVTTTIGAEGMGLVHGETAMIQDDPHAFVRDVVRLYKDDGLWMRLATGGQKYITRNFGPDAVLQKLKMLKDLALHGRTN